MVWCFFQAFYLNFIFFSDVFNIFLSDPLLEKSSGKDPADLTHFQRVKKGCIGTEWVEAFSLLNEICECKGFGQVRQIIIFWLGNIPGINFALSPRKKYIAIFTH